MKENHPSKPSGVTWKGVMIGGIPGILIGAAGELAAQTAFAQPDPPESIPDNHVTHFEGEVQVAHGVNDDMSFNEAFATARHEVGAGGAFVWHGQVYGTYRADDPEWMEMSDEERLEHSEWILSQVHGTPYTPDEPEQPHIPEHIEMDEFATIIDEDGNVVQIATGEADGHSAVFVDADMNDEVETVLVDLNDNEVLDDNEVIDTEGAGILMSDHDFMATVYGPPPIDDDEDFPIADVYGPPPIDDPVL